MPSSDATNEKPDFQAVINRLKAALHLATNKDVAEQLGLTATNLGERKARNALPMRAIGELCARHGLSRDWVFTGNGEMHAQAPPPLASPMDLELHTRCVEAVMAELERRGMQLDADVRGRVYKALHDMSLPGPKVNERALGALLDVALTGAGRYASERLPKHQTTFHGEVGAVHTVHEGRMNVSHGPTRRARKNPPKG